MKTLPIVITMALAVLAGHAPLAGQQVELLPPDHWSIDAMRRLQSAGLTPRDHDIASLPTTVAAVRRALHVACADSTSISAHAICTQFDTDYPERVGGAWWDATILGGLSVQRGLIETGTFLPPVDWEGGLLIPATALPFGRVNFGAGIADRAAITFDGDVTTNDARVRTLAATIRTGPIAFTAGRLAPGYRTMRSGAVILQGVAPVNGVGFATVRPIQLHGLLRRLGALSVSGNLARMDSTLGMKQPWLLNGRIYISPFSWMGVGATRAAMFGSTSPDGSISIRQIFNTMIGQNSGQLDTDAYADNQSAAVDGWFRLPREILPLTFYWDWGSDDSAGAWWQVPAHIFGLELAEVPGVEWLSVGAERTLIEHSCCGNGPWYWHAEMLRGWTSHGVPLGHPIGGQGRENRVFGRIDRGPIRAYGAVFAGVRGEENLLHPAHEGRFKGIAGDIRVRGLRQLDFAVTGRIEDGAGWRTYDVRTFVSAPLAGILRQ
jgi:hypothetical protein